MSSGQQFDWEHVRQQLAEASRKVAEAATLKPAEKKELLDKRAHDLARVPLQQFDQQEDLELVEFRLGKQSFAIESRFVSEVIRPNFMTRVPGADSYVIGVTNLRGEILTVLDLSEFFGAAMIPASEGEEAGGDEDKNAMPVIVLGSARGEFGVIADVVDQVTILPAGDILPNPPSLTGRASEYVRGVTAEAQLILNGEALLSDETLIIDQRD